MINVWKCVTLHVIKWVLNQILVERKNICSRIAKLVSNCLRMCQIQRSASEDTSDLQFIN